MTGEPDGRDSAVVARQPRPGPGRIWQWLRTILLLLWVASSAFTWWSAPRPATVDDALADLASGEAVAHRWAGPYHSWTGGDGPDGGPVDLSYGEYLVWRTADRRVHYVALGAVDGFGDSLFPEPDGPAVDPQLRALAAAVDEAAPAGGRNPQTWPVLSVALGLACLVLLVNGPPPRTGTRWYWFWIGAGVPLGLGLVAWLLWERPWARGVVERQPRRRGLTGFLLGLGLAIGGGLLLSLVRGAAGGGLIPPVPPY